jgi:hypothetical protein
MLRRPYGLPVPSPSLSFLSGNRKVIQNEIMAMQNYENKLKGKTNVPDKIKVK